ATATTAIGEVTLLAHERGPVTVLLRPEDLRLVGGGDAVVELTEYFGHDTVYLVRTASGAKVRVRAGSAPAHRRGDVVTVAYAGGPAVSYRGAAEDGDAAHDGAPDVPDRLPTS
ncbi:MAG: TOBE domain-containing protein, partial [Acidimicrobiales bacterium]